LDKLKFPFSQVVSSGKLEDMPDIERLWQNHNSILENCRLCPRLVAWREEIASRRRRAFYDWDYWGKPVLGFGDIHARLLVVGLAPAAHGGNRTGRVFTGDSSADFLIGALYRAGFANQPTSTHKSDGLALTDIFISAVCRCAPPDNRPTPEELQTCRPYLERELELLERVQTVVALGQIAFDGMLRLLRDQGHTLPKLKFKHAAGYELGGELPTIIASYHPSRQNTQTGRLTEAMFDEVWEKARASLKPGSTYRSIS
jgi:uracil-DNA glycosylase